MSRLRVGFFRLTVVLWVLVILAGPVIYAPGPTSTLPDVFFRLGQWLVGIAASGLIIWGIYCATIWIASGFSGGQAVKPSRTLVIASALIGTWLAGSGLERLAENLLERREQAEMRQLEQERREDLRQQALAQEREEAQRKTQIAEQAKYERQIDGRSQEILAAFPEPSRNRDTDLMPPLAKPRVFGASDKSRRTPETAEEYLVSCAEYWVRRKCAEALAVFEQEHGIQFDVPAWLERKELARVKAEAQVKAAATRRQVQARVEAENQAAEERNRVERSRLLEVYQGAGLITEWCAANHGIVFGPKDSVRASMQAECAKAAGTQ